MKKIIHTTSIAMLTIGCISACLSTPTIQNKPTATINHTTSVKLELGENVFLKDQQLNLTFDKIINDSRCPTGVQCIWAGNATVAVTAMTTSSRPQVLNLSIGDLRGELSQTQRFANFEITLDTLTPKIVSNQTASISKDNPPSIQLTIKQMP